MTQKTPDTRPTLSNQTNDPRYNASKVPQIEPENYTIEGEFARGGMGRILKATDLRIGRPVALKESLGARGKMLERFYREAMVTARLQHPGIVPIYELGRWPDGQPFYTMRFVQGQSLESVLEQTKTLKERLALLPSIISSCEAVGYAHAHKIVHRDIKPANILLGAFGETVVVDWGIAKDLRSQLPDLVDEEVPAEKSNASAPSLTMAGAIMGTPTYMPLEQAHGLAIDERVDVYALGAMLYQVLSGDPPYKGNTAQEILMDVIEKPPVPLAEKQKNLPPDLIAIVNKAMAREAKDRYPNAGDLARDLQKFQTGQIVDAYQYTPWELIKRFLWKNVAVFSVTAIFGVILLVSFVRSYLSILEAQRYAAAQAEARTRESMNLTLQLARTSLELDPTRTLSYLKELSNFSYFQDWETLRTIAADASLRGVPIELKGMATIKIPLVDLAFSPVGASLVTADTEGNLRLWNTENQQEVSWRDSAPLKWVQFFDAGARIVSINAQHQLKTWDATSHQQLQTIQSEAPILGYHLLPSKKQLALACDDGKVRVYSLDTAQLVYTLETSFRAAHQVRFSYDGKWLAALGDSPGVALWEVSTQRRLTLPAGHTEAPSTLEFSPNNTWLATAGKDKEVLLWALKEPAPTAEPASEPSSMPAALASGGLLPPRRLQGHEWPVYGLAFSPNEQKLASASEDRSIRIWSLDACGADTCESKVLARHKGSVLSVEFSPDGNFLASTSRDRSIRLWDVATLQEAAQLRSTLSSPLRANFSPDGTQLVSLSEDHVARLWDLSQIETKIFYGHTDGLFAVDYSPDGKMIVSGGSDKTIHLWDAACNQQKDWKFCDKPIAILPASSVVWGLDFSPNGKSLAVALAGGSIDIWSLDQMKKTTTLTGHQGDVLSVTWAPDGTMLASCGADKSVRLWSADGKALRTFEGHQDSVLDLDFAHDGKSLISASLDGYLIHWSLSTGQEISRMEGKNGEKFSSVAFSPDQKMVAAGSYSSRIMLYPLDASGKLSAASKTLTQHQGEIEAVDFSPDGLTLASASWDGTARLWSLGSASTESRALRSHGKDATGVVFSPDGTYFVFVSEDREVHMIRDVLPREPSLLKTWLRNLALPTF